MMLCLLRIALLLPLLVRSDPVDKVNLKEKLHYAAFGGANSWGMGTHLENRFHSFPYLLDRDLHNYASMSPTANYEAVCLQTILNDNVYDVVLLDYSHAVDSNLRSLAQRLRQRFPQAIIVFLKYWRPLDIVRSSRDNNFDNVDLITWMTQRGLTDWVSVDFQRALDEDSDGIWFNQQQQNGSSDLLDEYAAEVNGVVVTIADMDLGNVKQGLKEFGKYFARSTLLSAEGHAMAAQRIREAIEFHNIRDEDIEDEADFTGGDSCNLWLHSAAKFPYEHNGGEVNFFDKIHGMYALEFDKSGFVYIENPFPQKRRLYVSFLVSNQEGKYPTTVVQISPVQPIGVKEGVEGDYVKTLPVGFVQPGRNRLWINPDMSTGSEPFRLVGVHFANEHVTPDLYDFVPMWAH